MQEGDRQMYVGDRKAKKNIAKTSKWANIHTHPYIILIIRLNPNREHLQTEKSA